MSVFPASFDFSSLDGSNGYIINGVSSGGESGRAVSSAGDINGDGIDDIFIGAFYADSNGVSRAGESYVVFGNTNNSNLELSSLDGSNGFALYGSVTGGRSGYSGSRAGDINHDGIEDLIVGATHTGGRGEVYVIYGSSQGFSSGIDLSNLQATTGLTLRDGGGSNLGFDVSDGGDLNGDNIDDLLISTPFSNDGEAYVVYGSSTGFGADVDLATLDGSNGFLVDGDGYRFTGWAISGIGDVNSDGLDDFVVGVRDSDPNGIANAGESYVVFGSSSTGSVLSLSSIDGTNGFSLSGTTAGGRVGEAVSGAGDINHDGISDFMIGARSLGETYVVFGNSSGFASHLSLSSLDGTNGFTLTGTGRDEAGFALSNANDVNDDGVDDIVIGAYSAGRNGASQTGKSYVVFGNSNGFNNTFHLSSLDGDNGFVLNGIDGNDRSGVSVGGAGDFNADGISDLIIGASGADPGGRSSAGESYVVFGRGSNAGDDVIDTLPSDSTVDAGAGDDVIRAQGGNDTLSGGSGSDRIYANGGNDILQGDDGDDTLHGGAGNDTLEGGNNNDILDGGAGLDTVNGGSGSDVLLGYADADTLNGGSGSDVLFGHQGNDLLHGDDDSDRLYGGSGMDFLYGDAGDDQLRGGEDDDSLFGGEGNDSLEGNSGNDELQGNAGDDFLYGGGGDDTVDGGTGDDAIFAQAGDDTAIGGEGNDVLYGGGGNDTLIGGGLGSTSLGQIDRLIGGAGRDTYVVASMYATDADRDFAIIRGFNKAEDTIQLSDDTHTLADISVGSGLYATAGTGIYSSSGDLLAVVESYAAGSLNLTANYFVVV